MKTLKKSSNDQPADEPKSARRELIYKSTAIGLLIGAFALFVSPIVAFFQPEAIVAADEPLELANEIPVMDIFDGPQGSDGVHYWSFKDFPFHVKHSVVAEKLLKEEIYALPDSVEPVQSESSRELFQMISASFLPLKSVGEIDFYGIEQAELCVAIAAHRDSQSILAGTLAYPQKPGFFTVIRLHPMTQSVNQKSGQNLLPMGSDLHTVCSGYSNDGSLIAEVIESSTDLESHVANWKKAGWVVEQFDADDSDDVLIGCHKGNTHIAVARFNSALATGNTFLIRKVAMNKTD